MKKSRVHKTSDSFNNLSLNFGTMHDGNDEFPFVMDSPEKKSNH